MRLKYEFLYRLLYLRWKSINYKKANDSRISKKEEEEETEQEQETILEEDSKDRNLEADFPWSRFSKDDKPLLFRDCLKQEDSPDITNS